MCSSVSVPMKGVELQRGNKTNKRGNVGDLVRRLNARSFGQVHVKIKEPRRGVAIIRRILDPFPGSRRTRVLRSMGRDISTVSRFVGKGGFLRAVGRFGGEN